MPTSIKVSGAWKEISYEYVKISGVWRPVREGYVKVAGVWKRVHYERVPAGCVIWKYSGTPTGWTLANGSGGTPSLTSNRYILVRSPTLVTGGATSHTHSYSGTTWSTGNSPVNTVKANTAPTTSLTAHYHSSSHSHTDNNNPYYTRLLPYVNGTYLPAGCYVLYSQTGTPSWGTEISSYNGRLLMGSTAYSSSGVGTHTSSYSGVSGYSSNSYSNNTSGGAAGHIANHRHNITHTHAATTSMPAYVDLRLFNVTSTIYEVQPGMCFLTSAATTPQGYTDLTPSHSSRYIRLYNGTPEGHGSSNSHTIASAAFTTGAYRDEALTRETTGGPPYKHNAHTHRFDHGHASLSLAPIYTTLRLIRKD